MHSFVSRIQVVGVTFAIGATLSGLAALSGGSKMGWGPIESVEVWLSVLAGPFSGLWATTTWELTDAIFWALVLGFAIAAHPIFRGELPALISMIGVGLWVLFGFMLTYDGV